MAFLQGMREKFVPVETSHLLDENMKKGERKGKNFFSDQSYSMPFPLLLPLESADCLGYNEAIYNWYVKKLDST